MAAQMRLYDDIRPHHKNMLGEREAVGDGQEELSSEPRPEEPPPAPRPVTTRSPSDPVAIRATFLSLRRSEDEIGLEELLRAERQDFEERGRELVAAAQEDSPGPAVDLPRFERLEGDLRLPALERRFGTLFPLVEYGPPFLLKEEIRAIEDLAERDWRLGSGSFAEWMQSPRWLTWCLTWAVGPWARPDGALTSSVTSGKPARPDAASHCRQ